MSGSFESVFNYFRKKVSGDKNRLITSTIDIDFTYITDRVIAMSYPAEGLESAFRNHIDDVASYLNGTHEGHYMIYNLSQRFYDYSKFSNVTDRFGWPDHHAPPINVLFAALHDMYCFLSADPINVVVVHCLAGKGRTGCLIAAFFVFSNLFDNSIDSRGFFAFQRSMNNWGVSGPSQIRTVDWFTSLLQEKRYPSIAKHRLVKIEITNMPNLSLSPGKSGFSPLLSLFDFNSLNVEMIPIWNNKENLIVYERNRIDAIEIELDLVVMGDLQLLIEHISVFKKEKVARLSLHTDIIPPSNTLVFGRNSFDDANNDDRFPINFEMLMIFEDVLDQSIESDTIIDESEYNYSCSVIETVFESSLKQDGSICFFEDEHMEEKIQFARSHARQQNNEDEGILHKGGYLTKEGLNVKNWKRRWFVLHEDRIEYFSKPKSTAKLGTIVLNDIIAIFPLDSDSHIYPNMMQITTSDRVWKIFADTDDERYSWIKDIKNAMERSKKQLFRGELLFQFIEGNIDRKTSNSIKAYCILRIGPYEYRTPTSENALNPIWNTDMLTLEIYNSSFKLEMWNERSILGDELIGSASLNIVLDGTQVLEDEKTITLKKKHSSTSISTGTLTFYLKFTPLL